MSYVAKLEQFEGPLHLLLEMIEAEKLNISEISLAAVTENYLNFLEANPNLPAEELADFLVVASRLLLIKSKLLMPYLVLPEEEEGDLESQLKIYKEYLDASKHIEQLIGKRRFLYVHEKLPKVETGFAPPKKLTTDQMRALFIGVISRLEVVVKVPEAVIEKTVSIHEKITQIRRLVSKAERTSFKELVTGAESRIEVVVSFLALLELIKQRAVYVSQDGTFDDIMVNRASGDSVAVVEAETAKKKTETEKPLVAKPEPVPA
jgi:segregation and condensation protein A